MNLPFSHKALAPVYGGAKPGSFFLLSLFISTLLLESISVHAQWTTSNLSQPAASLTTASDGTRAFFVGNGFIDVYNSTNDGWSTHPLTQTSRPMTTLTLGSKVFFTGFPGADDFDVVIYDGDANSWTTHTLSQGGSAERMAAWSTKVYFGGGTDSGGNFTNIIDVYDTGPGTWSTLVVPADAGGGFGMAAAGGKLVLAAGANASNNVSYVKVYDIAADTWDQNLHNLPFDGAVMAIAHGSKIFCLKDMSTSLDVYDAGTGLWTPHTMTRGWDGEKPAIVENKIFFVSGYVLAESRVFIESYDNIANSWSVRETPSARDNIGVGSIGTKAFFAGGFTGQLQGKVAIDIYDNSTNTWSSDVLSVKRYSVSVASAGTKIFFAGGADGFPDFPTYDLIDVFNIGALTVTGFNPTSGIVGTSVTIAGTNFSGVPANNVVSFNGTAANVTSSTATSITTTVPAGASTGLISVTVGGQTGTSATNFTVIPVPTVTSFNPTSGIVSATVTITGTNFSTTPANNIVEFNGTTAVVTASTAISITTTVPAGATSGTISVTVGGQTGTSAASFTVIPVPSVTSFNPTSGIVGATVTLTGTGFSTTPANNTVRFNGTAAVATASTATSITTTVPAGATSGTISVTVGGQTGTSAASFTVIPVPSVVSFNPTSGPVGISVTITGTGFNATPANNTVRFNGTVAVVTASTSTSITTTAPVGATSGTISVTVGGQTGTSPGSFTVTTPVVVPSVNSFNPTSGPVGTSVIISGSNFSATPANNTVRFNGTTTTVTGSTTTSITTTVPVGATTGPVSVIVGGQTGTSSGNFTVTIPASVPLITNFNPTSGNVGTSVTITGTNFSTIPANNAVRFNGTLAIVTASTPTSITTSVPTGATTGTIAVTVGGQTATSTGSFTVTTPSPALAIHVGTDRAVCAGEEAKLGDTPLVTGGSGNVTVSWASQPGGFTSAALNPSVSPAVTTVYTVSVKDNNSDAAPSTADVTINVSATPDVSIVMPATAGLNEVVMFDYTTATSVASQTWDFGDDETSTDATVEHGYSVSGSYIVSIDVEDTNGCTDSDSKTIVIGEGPQLTDRSIKNVVTPNGDSKNAVLYIESIENMRGSEVVVLDRTGVEVYRQRDYKNDWDFRKGNNYLPAGAYLCVVKYEGKVASRSVTVISSK